MQLNSSLRFQYMSHVHPAIVSYKRKKCTRNSTLSQIKEIDLEIREFCLGHLSDFAGGVFSLPS